MGKTTAGINIRALTAADLAAVGKIDEQSFFDVWSQSMWLDELNNSLTTYLVLEENDKVLGYAGFWLVAGEAQVTRVAIEQGERERGLGTRLTAALINKAWELGAVAVTLEVRESNTAAQKVYLTCGFDSEGIRPNYYEDNHENAVIMWLYKEGSPHV
ncbi:ribosomal protein S18-alanine N-acetyltransferase [uncultured Phascolarctobacterium sp.]|uniref:ribosomal protein S18-alanine N-acetyltransferase n=1 Tax=uncultured Phascolarctobacterium sp. TaxID=512296 RepID=UPI0027D95693|nr:ribosomal protein S18-alanine N-acetyltransferase [uncultured Phascolarctobacterium sp.]